MKIVVDIKDKKVPFIRALLKNFKFVKVEKLPSEKSEVLEGIKQAVKEMKLIKAGKLKSARCKWFDRWVIKLNQYLILRDS